MQDYKNKCFEICCFQAFEETLKKYQKNGLECASAGTVHIYDEPGTYFAAARVKSERNGDANAIYTQVCNLARVRIIVEE